MNALSKIVAALPSGWAMVKFLIFLYALINIKNIPLMWHFRFYRSLTHHFFVRRTILAPPSHLFSPITTASRSPPYECDVNGHKSNSTYFSDLDIARTHLVCHLTKRAFAQRRAAKLPVMYVALAGVCCLFRKEIKPLQRYEIVSRVLTWDRKWVFVVSHFVEPAKKGTGPGGRRVYASALTKYVFKSGRVTVPPEALFRECELLPPRPDGLSDDDEGLVSVSGSDTGLRETNSGAAMEGRVEDLLKSDVERVETAEMRERGYWTWERVENERRRGMLVAEHMIRLDSLQDEFREGHEEGLAKIGTFGAAW